MFVNLPHSGRTPYESTSWEDISSFLTQISADPTLATLQTVVQAMIRKCTLASRLETEEEVKGTPGLRQAMAHLPDHNGEEVLLQDFLPQLVSLAMDMPKLFPEGSVDASGPVCLTRRQIACLLAHMFFCTLLPQPWNKYAVTFVAWHKHMFPSAQAYMHVLLSYFLQSFHMENPDENVVFTRHVLEVIPAWGTLPSPIGQVTTLLQGRIGDNDGEVQVDFANRDVGFGETGTQEELIFGMSPELCPVVLFQKTLGSLETLTLRGARCVGNYSGYGIGMKYEGLCTESFDWNERVVLAMDAVNFFEIRSDNILATQLEETRLQRELNKAYCGFRNAKRPVATGYWGCGAFRGDKEVKAIIQLLAASLAEVPLVFYCFGDHLFADRFNQVVQAATKHNMNIADCYAALGEFRSVVQETGRSDLSLFDWLLEKYGGPE